MLEFPDMVYVVMWHDRHAEPEPEVFTDPSVAVAWARKQARESANPSHPEDLDEELTPSMQRAGWLYYASYSCEGDKIWVLPKSVRSDIEEPH